MSKWHAYGSVVGGKYIGEFDAETGEEAIKKASRKAYVGLCHQCSRECENAEIESIRVEEVDGDGVLDEAAEADEATWEELARGAGWTPPGKKKAGKGKAVPRG